MGLIREPIDVDFFVDPRPLTKEEEAIISNFIKADKEKRALKKKRKKKSPSNPKRDKKITS